MNVVVCAVDDGELDWMIACVSCEQQYSRWSNFAQEMNQFYVPAGDFVVDAVHVLQVSTYMFYPLANAAFAFSSS